MGRSQLPQLNLTQASPEVLSYVYQSLMDFEPYTTPNTEVSVIAKDPLKLDKAQSGESLPPRKELMKMYRICISLSNEGTRIEAEALDRDIFTAIRRAKEKLIKQLEEIHDNVVSSSQRHQEIQFALAQRGRYLH
ncbi:MAG: hypothetical protein C5B49_13360 [Bdellovibrio sp.]|nr:MAG: hypothetical protein C5B49_13360 [Bdellovibrio sp.]